jgi:AmmeMemoRadiSam system protein A
MLSIGQGELLIGLARKSITNLTECIDDTELRNQVRKGEAWLQEKHGVFTTIHSYPKNELRGCIGFPLPMFPLGIAVLDSAKSACCDDRFKPLSKSELGKILVEISVLSIPVEVKHNSSTELLEKLSGKEGLIIRFGTNSGLFLPQVWKELPDKEDFLDRLCQKAWLEPGTWRMPDAKLMSFTAQIFKEVKPKGRVVEVKE